MWFFSNDSIFGKANSSEEDAKQVQSVLSQFHKKDSAFWSNAGQKYFLSLFQLMAQKVPAYADFLKANNIDGSTIKSWDDWNQVPIMNKNNYLRQHTMEQLCLGGDLKKSMVLTATSGSTGVPFYFPRDEALDWQSSIMHELFLANNPLAHDQSTLIINCFGMGVWIGGIITYQAFKKIADRGYPLTIITPGLNKKEIFESLKNLGSKFEQVVICGYPPFIKGIVDEAGDYGIDWKSFNMKVVFAAEPFSEKFRDYIAAKANIKNVYTDTMNIYGSADLGTMAEETPLSILIRRLASDNPALYSDLFKVSGRMPTLAQFNPLFTNFEECNGEVLCSGYSALPLLRYAIGDHGGVMTYDEVENKFQKHGIDLAAEMKRLGMERTLTKLPFVFVYERSDFSTKLYGAIIYPEHVKESLHHHPKILDNLTGKFTMITKSDDTHNQYLEINLEMKKNTKHNDDLKKTVRDVIVNNLLEKNAEYKNNASMMPEKVEPRIVFWEHEHPTHFNPVGKQKWVKSE